MRRKSALVAGLLVASSMLSVHAADGDYRPIPAGAIESVLPPDGKTAPARVAAFQLRTTPVTNAEFLAFVTGARRWRRGEAPSLFVDANYLGHWAASDQLGANALPDQPVTQVSWHAARAYCASENARLPTWHEWEYAAAADATRADARSDPAWRERILGWYSTPSNVALAAVGAQPPDLHGIHDLHGLVWEWVDDYASLMVSGDNREQGDPDLLKFCGAGALSMQDRDNYAVLMRIAMLSSLRAADTTRNLGFRCARSVTEPTP